jgi:hypothetical protein
LLLAGSLVLGADVEDAVGVDVELHFDLRHAARSRRDAGQNETAKGFVVGSHFAFTLQDMDFHRSLAVGSCREHLLFRGRNRGVAVDQLGHDTA